MKYLLFLLYSIFSTAQVVGTPYFFTPDNRPILDQVGGGASVAYSSRKLSSTYTGFAMKVRRTSDQTTADIGFDTDGNLNTTALLAFVGTASAYVTTWYDQSGNGKDLTQPTNAYQPRIVASGVIDKENSRPFIRFYGTLNSNTVFNSLNLATEITTTAQVVIVNKFAAAGDGFLLGHSSSVYYWHSSPPSILFANIASTSVYNGTMFQNGVSKTNTSIPWNTSLAINSIAPTTPTTGTNWNNIGRDRTYHHISGGGGYAEIIIFSSAITIDQRLLIERNQGQYFGITVL